ncbi:MAG TPA: DUF350 domain-containing protein [Pyrinomonadaceae bacterium]|jgi:uncharacterized membrane protein YjfL (UPF0719 family)|nr:DUF350 domain-containing protein [Pyrinomonadaceae bacterium]
MLIESIAPHASGVAASASAHGVGLLLLVPLDQLMPLVVSTLVFAAIGIVLFAVAFVIIVKATPFSIRKEIEDDQNTALAIVIAAVILGIAIIVASAIH